MGKETIFLRYSVSYFFPSIVFHFFFNGPRFWFFFSLPRLFIAELFFTLTKIKKKSKKKLQGKVRWRCQIALNYEMNRIPKSIAMFVFDLITHFYGCRSFAFPFLSLHFNRKTLNSIPWIKVDDDVFSCVLSSHNAKKLLSRTSPV